MTRKLLFILFHLALSSFAFAQAPVANFTVNARSGCVPFNVTFSDLSTGDPKFWNWDFGNGQLSTLQNPSTVYNLPGVYTVKLVVRNANGTDGITQTNYITVSASPVPFFTSDLRNGCMPSVVHFTDASTPVGGIASWLWDFGDGSSSTQQNPSHTYNANGFYTVGLTIKNAAGCIGEIRMSRLIRIVSGVKADFSNISPATCRPPFAINFNNETSGPGNLTYAWDFGNGSTDVVQNPTSIYTTSGTYPVRLIANSDYGCSDTITKNIDVKGYATGITAADTSCLISAVAFQNNSTITPRKVTWDFGDGSGSALLNPVHTYASPGNYLVKVHNEYSDCQDSAFKTITIKGPPVPDFSANNTISCKGPFPVTFQDLSPGAVSWSWDFGDGSPVSTAQNPVHNYINPGAYTVRLMITDRFGCVGDTSKTDFISIEPPTVSILNPDQGGCAPFFVYYPQVDAKSFDGIAAYNWDFGDGTTGTGPAPNHAYPVVGTYNVKLRITSTGGCMDSTSTVIKIGTDPSPAFSFTPAGAPCAFSSVQFNNLTPITSPDYSFIWDFGDFNASFDKDPQYNFKDTGVFNVTLTAVNNGCAASLTKTINIRPPVAEFDFIVNCSNGRDVTFLNLSKTDPAYGPPVYSWNYGDNSPIYTGVAQTHIYANTGIYQVSLTVTNGTCSHTLTKTIRLTQEKADFQISKQSPLCKDDEVTFSAITSNAANIQTYTWRIGNETFDSSRSFKYKFTVNGTYDIALTILDSNGCSDTKTLPGFITVSGPTADFTRAPGTCRSAPVTFTDLSSSPIAIANWKWDFGDGTIQNFTAPPFIHNYSDTGFFNVYLTIKDINGCVDSASIVNAVYISSPKVFFSSDTTLLCPGAAITFRDSSFGTALNYKWDFGDGTTSSQQQPRHVFPAGDSAYTIKLVVTDINGCSDSLTKNKYIKVRYPKPAFSAKDTVSICPPLETKFFFAGSDYESFYWDFGDSSGISTLKDPNHFYNDYGTYTAKLYLLGYGGCIDSAMHQIILPDPTLSKITYNPLSACSPANVTFDVTPPPHTFYAVYFGDGIIDSTQNKTPTHVYNSPAFYYPALYLRDSIGCEVSVSGASDIRVIGAQPLFSIDKKAFCDTGIVYFTNYTLNNDPIVSTVWDFGDGNTTTDISPTHRFDTPGTFIPTLTVQTQNGCVSSITDTIRVYQTPVVSITNIDSICINAPALFSGNLPLPDSNVSFNWNFGNGQTSTEMNPITKFLKTGPFNVRVDTKVPFGCSSSSDKTVYVVSGPTVTMGPGQTIIAGTGIDLPVTYSGKIINYNWTPVNRLSCTNCAVPFASPFRTTTYRVAVTDENGCSSTGDITIQVVCGAKNIFVPNTFSPNNDGNNDRFYPRGAGITRIQSMRIFNRWGETVFEKINFNVNESASGWDGTFKGKKADADVYVYIIEVICETGEIFPFKGNVMLLK
ncbi:MAG TPA: PKD domain-containing protein [Flavitalea sp.]|nr:PKD domain-containing protein [Flavitalea sp.]